MSSPARCSSIRRWNFARYWRGRFLEENATLGLAVAELGRKVDDPWQTVALPQTDGSFLIDGQKIYTTGAAEADYIVVWAFNPHVEGIATNPLLGVQGNLVPANTPGVTIYRDWDTIGQRATELGHHYLCEG